MELQTVTQTITDPADWDGSLFGTQLELVQLAEDDFKSTQSVTDLGQGVKLLQLSVNQSVKVRSRPLSLRYVAAIFDRAHGGHFSGASIEDGQLLIVPPDFDFDASIKDGAFSCTTLFVPPDQLEAHYQALAGEKLGSFETVKTSRLPSEEQRWLAMWPELVDPLNLAALPQEQGIRFQGTLRDSALTLLSHALQSNSLAVSDQDRIQSSESRLAKARKLVRLAEDFANHSAESNVRMVDLCNATNVSERTLQYAFKTCLGISPMNYLKRLRLHRVRQELKLANPKRSTVSSIACQYGFFHFGEFSRAYKAQFDESPSQTLNR